MTTKVKGCEAVVADDEFFGCYFLRQSCRSFSLSLCIRLIDVLGCAVGCRIATRSFCHHIVSPSFLSSEKER